MNKRKDIRVASVDDHDVVRQGLISLLNRNPRIQVVGEARNGKEALDLLKEIHVHVIIMDLEMPLMNGAEAFSIIKHRFPEVKVIFLSMHNEGTLTAQYISQGAAGFLGKDCNIEELETAIVTVFEKGYYFDEKSSVAMCNELKKKTSFVAFGQLALTDRETEILKLICEDKSNKEIGKILSIEARTVDFHRRNIYEKSKCRKPAALALYAIRNGIVSINNTKI